jgi:alpha-D-ribose 1-methylphosphonate 5-triphosphate synthase subunit PhnI
MYVAVKGGEAAIRNAHKLLADRRRGDRSLPSLTLAQIAEQLALACDRVMAEGSLYDKELAALAIKQARGDLIEAIFLLRAYRTTLPRFGYSASRSTRRDAGRAPRLGDLQGSAGRPDARPDLRLHPPPARSGRRDGDVDAAVRREGDGTPVMRVSDILAQEGLIEADGLRRAGRRDRRPDPHRRWNFPMDRDTRLQALARGDEGFLLALGYSTQRGYGRSHPFVGESASARSM